MTTNPPVSARRVRARRVPRQPQPSDRLLAVGAAMMQDLCERGSSSPETTATLLAMPGEALLSYLRSQKLRFAGATEDVRLIRAFALLRAGGVDAERVAVDHGFRNSVSLLRAFQRRFGCLPSQSIDAPPTPAAQAAQRLRQWRDDPGVIAASELQKVFDALDVVPREALVGAWRGGGFDTGHPVLRQLHRLRWVGKTFHSIDKVDPLICRADDGSHYADDKTMGGGASLQMIEYRGKVSAAMVYDARPVIDHFRRVDAVTLLGVMTGRNTLYQGQPFYFYLKRDRA
jgi:AraC-like DNA-binding protein